MFSKNLDLGREKIGKLLVKMAFPAIISMVVNGLYYLVDAVFISWGVGSRALAGLAIIFPIQMIGMGSASIISRKLGASDVETAERAAMNSISLSLLFGFILTTLTVLFQRPLMFSLGATDYNFQYAREYLFYIQMGFVFVFLSMIGFNITRAQGNAKAAGMGMLLGTVINLILDPLFIFTFKMGVGGAALATVIALLLSTLFFVVMLRKKESAIRISFRKIGFEIRLIKQLLSLGLGNFFGQFCLSILAIIINLSLRRYGNDIDLAVYGILSRIHVFIAMPLLGLAQGFQPIAGYNYGAKKTTRVRHVTMSALGASVGIGAVLFIFTAFFPITVMSLFSNDISLTEAGTAPLRITLLLLPVIGIQIIGFFFFQAIGKVLNTLILSLSRQFLILVPLLMIFPLFLGTNGLWYAYPVADGISVILSLLLMQSARRKISEGTLILAKEST